MLNFNSILLFSENPQKLAKFYQKVFQKKPDMEMNNYFGFMVGSAFFNIGFHDKVKGKNNQPERFIFNLETSKVEEEFERIKMLGAKVVKEPYHPAEESKMMIATFEDPDRNYFQLASPWNEEK